MSTIEEIKLAIEKLSPEERAELELLLHGEPGDDEWDRQMKEDAKAGKLDFMVRQAQEAIKKGQLRDFP
jgi:hypothetical protein